MQFGLFVTGLLWLVAAQTAAGRSAQGLANRINSPLLDSPLEQAFFLFLLLVGFAVLNWIATRTGGGLRSTNALPSRPTARQEFSRGAALGWGLLLVALLPMMILGDLHPAYSFALVSWEQLAFSIVTLAFGTLALEAAFRGYLYRRLIGAMGTVPATIFLCFLYAVFSAFRPNSSAPSFVVTFLFAVFLSIAYLRTHALWLGWGLHFAWAVATGVLFGLPVPGYANYSTVVQTSVSGRDWFTGGAYGPNASFVAGIVLLAAIPLLYRITRDYSWEYTHEPIVAAGYALEIAPPKAHTDMEAAAAVAPAPLVQILGTTSTTASTLPVIDEHLRASSVTDPID
jgi:membrane protease YdiL (CAAX protease family)